MALKTFDDVAEKITQLGLPLTVQTRQIATASVQEVVYTTGQTLFSVLTGTRYSGNFNLAFSNLINLDKYSRVSGATAAAMQVDLIWHMLDGFNELSSFVNLRKRIAQPDSCGALATTIAVNRYISSHNSSPEEIKELFYKSKWRWTKTELGEYVQGTIYPINSINSILYNLSITTDNTLSHVDNLVATITRFVRTQTERQEQEAQRRLTNLQGYTARATEFFSFKTGKDKRFTTFLGVELELENHSDREYPTLKTLKDHAIFKRDGSLNNGVEICTAPATLDVHKEAFSSFFGALDQNKSKLKAMDTCGMHVHIDRAKLSALHIANMCLLLNNQENEAAISRLAGRGANRYCKTYSHKYGDFTGGSVPDRYHRVNLTPSNTVELRLFASTTKYEEFCTRMEFTQAVIDYTRPGVVDLSCKDIPKWQNFVSFVLKHRNFYPTLAKEV